MGIVLNSAKGTAVSSLNAVSTAAATVDKTAGMLYYMADAGEAHAKGYARDAKILIAENEEHRLNQKRTDLAITRAQAQEQLEIQLQSSPRLAELFHQHMEDIKQSQDKALAAIDAKP